MDIKFGIYQKWLIHLVCLLILISCKGKIHSGTNESNPTSRKAPDISEIKSSNENTYLHEVPSYVKETYEFVTQYGEAKEGFVGGRIFQNREKRLPQKSISGKKIIYQEWDVHRKMKGKNRGAERLITSNVKTAYYTKNHYKSFIQIK